MSDEPRTFTLAVDSELHGGREPEGDIQRITWETLDTVWNILRESAVRVVLTEIREQLATAGFTGMPTDEELFAKADADPEMPKDYLDLAPQRGDGPAVELAGVSLQNAFNTLAEQAMADAVAGFGFTGLSDK